MTINWHQLKKYIQHFVTAKRNGHGIHSPFAYQLCEEVFYNTQRFYAFDTLNLLRKELEQNQEKITIEDFGAGSKTFKSSTRKISEIAKRGISLPKQSELLYRLLYFLKCTNAVELGSSLGLNALYMASVDKKIQVFSIEGSDKLHQFAKSLAHKNGMDSVKFIHGIFEDAFPELLQTIERLDFLYVDGNHTYSATLNYFKQALDKKHLNSVFIFDDIYWSADMTKAWEEIKQNTQVTLSIDAFYFGLVFFKSELKEKVDLRFFI
jgi:predicted O-methyltransferase YrrM